MKKVSRAQKYRIKRILDLIRNGTSSGFFPNCSVFCAELGVTRQTIMNDLDYLRDEERAPIEYVASSHGYRLTDETWQLPAVSISRHEIFAFSLARKLLGSFLGTPLEKDMRSVLGKIADSLEGKVTFDLDMFTDRFTVIGDDYVVQDPLIWKEVCCCLDTQQQISIVYEKFNSDTGEYILNPYHMFAYHGNWYLAAYNVRKKTVATFAISRIRKIRRTGEHFEMPDSFDALNYAKESFGIVRGDKVFRVRLLFSRKIAGYIKERVWHSDQKIVEKRNGDIVLSFETAGWKELVRWILSWQPDVKVLAPKRLADRIREKMKEGLNSF
ncbi:helix-turn-helix transcriptional regulator [Verrucomicrobiota bacterium]